MLVCMGYSPLLFKILCMNRNFSFRAVAAAVVTSSFILVSCQKEQLSRAEQSPLVSGLAAQQKTAIQPAAGSDEAFDQEIDAVIHSWNERMHTAMQQMTCEPDVDFARMQIMHHQMGVDMAEVALKYEHHKEAIRLTEKSRDANLKSIKRLEDALAKHENNIYLTGEQCATFKSAMMMEMMNMQEGMEAALHQRDRNDVDVDFSELIIEHHKGAIAMSQLELEYGHDHKIRKEADKLIDEQAKEIEEFSDFKNDHIYGRL
jgi:uncharacterized protein (DUF305 family)